MPGMESSDQSDYESQDESDNEESKKRDGYGEAILPPFH